MSEFRYDQDRKAIVRVVEEVAGDDAEAQLQQELDIAQNTLNTATELHDRLQAELDALELQVTAKGDEVEAAKAGQLAADADLKSAVDGRDSLAQARALQQELANADPAEEFDGQSEAVDIPITVATESPA